MEVVMRQLNVRLSDEEFVELGRRAHAALMSKSEFVRWRVLGEVERVVVPVPPRQVPVGRPPVGSRDVVSRLKGQR